MTNTNRQKQSRKPADGPEPAPAIETPADTALTVHGPSAPFLDVRLLQDTALLALQTVCLAADAPSAAKAAAARTLLEYCGAIGRHAPEPQTRAADKPLSEMSLDEIDAQIRALEPPKTPGKPGKSTP